MKKLTIAIDGHASTGKSSIAKALAVSLGYSYINSGSMYRAVTLYAVENNLMNLIDNNIDQFIKLLNNNKIHFKFNQNFISEIFLNDRNIENEIKSLKISQKVSIVAAIPEIRKEMVKLQRNIDRNKGIVMDGRDIGSVVFPNADVKFYLDASLEKRAERRWMELQKIEQVSLDDVKKDLHKRDLKDLNREFSPLIKPKNSITVNSDNLSIEQVVDNMIKIIDKVLHS